MTKIAQIPRIVLTYGLTAVIILLTSLFTSGSLDIAMHDTYFVISKIQIVIALGLLFIFFALVTWGIYFLLRRLSSVLNWLHYGITILSLAIVAVLTNYLASQNTTYREYSVYDEIENYEHQMSMNEWLTAIGVILVLSQSLFIINIIRAFIVKRKSH